jgi:hypothetical protein
MKKKIKYDDINKMKKLTLDELHEMMTCQGHMARVDDTWDLMNIVNATRLIEIDW